MQSLAGEGCAIGTSRMCEIKMHDILRVGLIVEERQVKFANIRETWESMRGKSKL